MSVIAGQSNRQESILMLPRQRRSKHNRQKAEARKERLEAQPAGQRSAP
jgi:hypothetical protein